MSLGEANTDYMKQLRLNMLNEKHSDIVIVTTKGFHPFRTYSIDNFKQHFDDVMSKTQTDGTIEDSVCVTLILDP